MNKKLVFRILGLAAIVLTSNLPLANAAVGDCHITCCDGSTWHGPAPSGTTCCQLFANLCASAGDAYQDTRWGKLYCINWECGV